MSPTREDVIREVETAHAAAKATLMTLERLYRELTEAYDATDAGEPERQAAGACQHQRTQPASAMGSDELRNFCTDCQSFVYADGRTEKLEM